MTATDRQADAKLVAVAHPDTPSVRSRPASSRRAPALLSGGLAAIVALCLAPGAAQAGTYEVVACQAAADHGYANNSWQPFNTAASFYRTSRSCPVDAGGRTAGINVSEQPDVVGFMPLGASAGWRFQAPAGTHISALSYSRYLGQWADNAKVPALRDANGNAIGGESCVFDATQSECSLGSPTPSIAFRTITGLNTTSLTASSTCQAAAPATGCAGSSRYGTDSWFSVYGSTVTITKSTPPAVAAGAWPDGWVRSAPAGTITARDTTGVRRVRAYVDGALVTDDLRFCDFSRPAPCTDVTDWSVGIGDVEQGTHGVVLAATNAASVEARTTQQTLRIDNEPPPPPTQLTSSVGTAWQTSSTAAVTWELPDEQDRAGVVAAHYRICSATSGTCTAPRPTTDVTSTDVELSTEGEYQVRVWLTDAAGNTAEANSSSTTIRYSTEPPAAPLGLATSTGSDWQRSGNVNLSWTPPSTGIGAPVTESFVQRCDLSRTACSTPTTASAQAATVALPSDGAYVVKVWLRNAAGLENPSATSETIVRFDATPPAAPQALLLTPQSPANVPNLSARWSRGHLSEGAPVAHANWTICQGTACPLSGQTSDTELSATVPHSGAWSVAVANVDAAGNVSVPSTGIFTYQPTSNQPPDPPDGQPRPPEDSLPPGEHPRHPEGPRPPDQPRPGDGQDPARTKPSLRVRSAIRGRVLTIRLNAPRSLSTIVRLTIRYQAGSKPRTTHRRVRLRRGSARARISLPRAVLAARITATTAATEQFSGARSVEEIRARRAPRPGAIR